MRWIISYLTGKNRNKRRCMKRITAILLMIITLFASSQWVVVYHYCGGILQSTNIAVLKKVSCCCADENQHETHSIQNQPCCSNFFLALHTDDFQHTNQTITLGSNTSSNLFAVTSSTFKLNNVFAENIREYKFPPPENIAKSGIDLLIAISILII
jgi:hypothetical protein